jgi:hypothetical protein
MPQYLANRFWVIYFIIETAKEAVQINAQCYPDLRDYIILIGEWNSFNFNVFFNFLEG